MGSTMEMRIEITTNSSKAADSLSAELKAKGYDSGLSLEANQDLVKFLDSSKDVVSY